MTDLETLVETLDQLGMTWSQTPDIHKGDCVQMGPSEGYETLEWFFDASGKFIRVALRKVATRPPDWMEITPNTCGGGP